MFSLECFLSNVVVFFIEMYLIYTTAVWLYVDMIYRNKMAREFDYMYGIT